jgi:L-cystine uptake protein TcyP (sodium:dicarboxylate symporter family)
LVILTALPKFFIGDAVSNFASLGLYLAAVYLGSLMVMALHSLIAVAINKPKGMNYPKAVVFYVKNTKEI